MKTRVKCNAITFYLSFHGISRIAFLPFLACLYQQLCQHESCRSMQTWIIVDSIHSACVKSMSTLCISFTNITWPRAHVTVWAWFPVDPSVWGPCGTPADFWILLSIGLSPKVKLCNDGAADCHCRLVSFRVVITLDHNRRYEGLEAEPTLAASRDYE